MEVLKVSTKSNPNSVAGALAAIIKEKNIKTYAKAKSYLKDRKRRQKYEIDYES